MSTEEAKSEIFEIAMAETRGVLRGWLARPWPIVVPWLAGAFAVAVTMLVGTLLVANNRGFSIGQDPSSAFDRPGVAGAFEVFQLNLLVLALHAFVCIAGFLAMRALPARVQYKKGFDRWIHHHASRAAMVFVGAATIFSMSTQIYGLGGIAAEQAAQYGITSAQLLRTTLPHSILELTAMFLPLSAFLIASQRRRWNELLAATVATVAIALPMLLTAAAIEAFVWREVLLDAINAS